jgi:hypothetical protein
MSPMTLTLNVTHMFTTPENGEPKKASDDRMKNPVLDFSSFLDSMQLLLTLCFALLTNSTDVFYACPSLYVLIILLSSSPSF